ncbi:tandem large repeat, partial [Aliivibrio sifiae]
MCLNRLFKLLISTLFLFLISSCGGESSDTSPPERKTTPVSGILFDAPIAGARVVIWEYANGLMGKKLGETTTSSAGEYSIEINSGSMPILVQAQGGAYTDPSTGKVVYEGGGKTLKFEATVYFNENKTNKVMLTPLSLVAKGLADYYIEIQGRDAASAINTANTTISNMYGFDVHTVEPIDIVRRGQSAYVSDGHKYGAYLTAYSSYALDLSKKYSAEEDDDIYTSFTLAELSYRDIAADGLLDGLEIDSISGLIKGISFGKEPVTSEMYSNNLAQHLLITVNSSLLNVSGTNPKDYEPFAARINSFGTSTDPIGIVPPRNETPIDDEVPTTKRTDSDILAKVDTIDLLLQDNVGLKGAEAYLQYKDSNGWSVEFACPEGDFGEGYCQFDLSSLKEGERESEAFVQVNTLNLDQVSDSIVEAKLLIYAEDIVGNKNITPTEISFTWDNKAPVIEVTSPTTFNPTIGTPYLLEGYVKEDSANIGTLTVSFNGGTPEILNCTPYNTANGYECSFQKNYEKELFVSSITQFTISAVDAIGNNGSFVHEVLSDIIKPTQSVSYPDAAMNFIQIVNNVRQEVTEPYNSSSFSNIDQANKFLNIQYGYAKDGLLAMHPTIDFENFNKAVLDTNQIPYIKVKVTDPADASSPGTNLGTSAELLVLNVSYTATEDGQNSASETFSVNSTMPNTIPHETISFDENGYAKEVIYYIPFTKEIFGEGFTSINEKHIQEITLTTKDASTNTSDPWITELRSSFNLPEVNVITPFVNATASFEIYADNGSPQLIATCTTAQDPMVSDPGQFALDVSSCSISSEYIGEVIKVTLSSRSSSTFYNQWSRKEKQTVELNAGSGFSAHVLLTESQNLYITELAVYQSGFFDYLWNLEPNKSKEKAKETLASVNKMLTEGKSFFGFNPVVTPYATNEEIESNTPTNPSLSYQHRYLLESLMILSDKSAIDDSVDFSKAFYGDFSSDGKPDGKGLDGSTITLGNYSLSEDTYRADLANIYYKYLKTLGIEESIAMAYADQYATANPVLNGENLFSDSGVSIDILPPNVTMNPTVDSIGKSFKKGNTWYISGEITAELNLKDPSGIDESNAERPLVLSPSWTNANGVNTVIPGMTFTPSSGNSQFDQNYVFVFNSASTEYADIKSFDLDVSVSDIHQNDYGYTSAPYADMFIVDNKAPEFEYRAPFYGLADPEYDENTYLNLNTKLNLTFLVSDVVGDLINVRQVVLTKGAIKKTLGKDDFYINTDQQFVISLCKSTVCTDDSDTVIDLDDGEWSFALEGEDLLGNRVRAQDMDAPKYVLNIDSSAPEVTTGTSAKFLGGNQKWNPNGVILWGSLSAAKDIKIKLNRPGSSWVDVVECSVGKGEPCNDYPAYLTGTAPNYEVQLVAEHFTHGVDNQFKVTAINAAFPSNSGEGTHTFKVDKNGPDILLTSPPLADMLSNGNNVMGRNFDIKITRVSDDSAVANLSVFQEKNDGTRVSLKENISVESPENPFQISLKNEETARIQLDTESNLVDLIVEASDEFGFTKNTNKIGMIYDIEGPSIALTNYSSSEYYRANYIFNLNALDLSLTGDVSASGVSQGTVKYWVYTGSEPAEGDSGNSPTVSEPNAIILNAPNGSDEVNLKILAKDVRGNESTQVPFVVKVNEAIPLTEFSMTYSDGAAIENNIATEKKDIKLILKIEDKSGIASVISSYTLEGVAGSNTINFSQTVDPKVWEATLSPNVDGTYLISATITNNTKANKESEVLKSEINPTLMVQTEGVELSITKPINFVSHISNKDLNVEFEKVNEAGIKTLECWVRENYIDEGVPADKTYYKIYNEPKNPECSITLDKNFLDNPVLITKTVGTNAAEKIQKFSFKMVDVEAPYIPYVKDKTGYALQSSEVIFEGEPEVKKLQLNIDYIDLDSNLDLTELPKLVANGVTFDPVTCEKSTGNSSLVSCKYKEDYVKLIRRIDTTHYVSSPNVIDNAGNTIPNNDRKFELIIPTGDFTTEITNLVDNQYINGKEITFDFRVKLFKESNLYDVTVSVAGDIYSLNNDVNNFENLIVCADDADAKCSTFTGQLPDDYALDNVNINLVATDVWANTAPSSRLVLLDNVAPTIGDTYQLSSGDSADKVRLTFDIADNISGSGLNNVMYQISDINFDETKTADFNYIDVDKNQIKDKDIISVQITAKDNVGLSIYKSIAIDLRKPVLTLEMGGNSELLGNKVALKERLQDFTIKSVPTESIKMTGFTLTLTNGSETISEAGDFVGNSGSSQFIFNDNQQGEYTLTLVAIDSIGRDIASFTYESMDFGASGATTYVDFSAPTIGAISGEQITPLPTNDLYKFDVKSVIQDANLNQNSIVSTVTFNSKSYSPTSMTKPSVVGEPYVFHYSVPAGTYVATVKATDFINQENSNTGSIEVAEATVPELTITSSHNDLGSEATSTITFSFSEDVIGFTKDDVVLSASDSGATGTLDMSTWTAGPAQSWTAIYTAPKGENKTVTISVAEGSYTSTITVDGNAATGDIAIKGVLPTVSNTVFNPIHADNLKSVEVKVDFSASVSDVKATLLTAPVSWISGQGSDKWVGNVVVPASSDDRLILMVSEFTDTYGNVGEADNSGVLYLTPSITVTPITGGVINESDASNVAISGTTTRFDVGKEITVAFSNSKDSSSLPTVTATVDSDGNWTAASANLSSWTDGTITVKATGSNQHNIAAKEAKTTAQLSTEKPTLTSVVSNPTSGKTGDNIEVTATFSVAVSNATAKLGSSDVVWTSGQDTAVWVGEVDIPSSSAADTEFTYRVQGFSDTNGNLGDPITTGSVYLTPSITITPITGGVINETDAANLIISGTTTRFEAGKEVTIAFSNSKDSSPLPTVTATVDSDGNWTAASANLSSWTDGTITVKATGSNQHNIAAKEATTTAQLSTEKPTLTSVVSNPTSGKTGDKIGVTATFSVAVNNATAKLGSSDVTWTSGQDTAVWVGEVDIPSSSAADTEFTYTVQGFSDTNGNLGDPTINGVVYLTPSIIVDAISGGVINSSDITNVVVSGDTSRFDDSQKVTLVLSNNVDAQTKNAEANIQGDGRWSMAAQDLSGWPDGEVTATVTGSNQHGIAAEAVTETATLSTAKPTLTSVVSNPTSGKTGDKIGVTATFSVAVNNATAKLGLSDVTWTSGQDTAVWVGEVEIPSSSAADTEFAYTVTGFSDINGNLGDESTSGIVYLTPSIVIDPISGGVINSSDITNVVVSGNTSRFDDSQKVILVLSNSKDAQTKTAEASVQGDGSWSMTAQDLTGWPDGEVVTATVTGSNQHGIAAEAVTETATLSAAKPTLTSMVSNPTSGKTGDRIGVTATFSVAVSNATAKLGLSDVTWTSGQGTAVWVGEVEIPSSSAADTEFAYTVTGFSDINGNLGDESTSGIVYLTPSIVIDPISGGVINSSDITNVVVSGNTSRFDDSQKVILVLSNSKDAQTKTAEASVQGDGSWSMTAQDLSGWPDGEVTATVTGSNQHGIAAEAVTETATLSTAKPTLTSVVSNPTSGKTGDKIGVTATFSVAVNNATAKLGSNDVTWTSGQDTAVWVGEV